MCRFFIIDQSLTGMGGHHFDYTRLVAQAASAAGVRPIIATNRSLDVETRNALQAYGEVRAVFPQTVYSAFSHLAGLRELKPRRPDIPDETVSQSPFGRWSAWRNRRRSRRLIRIRSRHICRFAESCEQLFSEFTFEDSDQVFFTTMSELDLMGLTCFLSNHPRSILPTWHLQFHFSIFSGRPAEFDAQRSREKRIHDCFHSALAKIPYHNLKFHSTSRELCEQYQRFELVRFSELPYPVEPRLIENQNDAVPRDRPLRLTVAGGVRREKSQKQYLAHLIAGLWDSHLSTGEIEIHIQTARRGKFGCRKIFGSTPSGPSGDEYRRRVLIHQHPLPQADYHELIGNSDVGLFFYDSRRYFSRRAGILGEFLASGKPVIVPAGCWLSRQIEESCFQHAENVLLDSDSVETLTLGETQWDSRNAPLSGGIIGFDQLKNPWRCTVRPREMETVDGIVIRFHWHWPLNHREFANITARYFDSNNQLLGENRQIVSVRENGAPTLALFRCPEKFSCAEFVVRNAYRDASLSIHEVQFSFLKYHSARGFPLASVGVIVADPSELPLAVAEIVDHYPHYLRSAVEFAGKWGTSHHPDCTLDALLDRESRFSRAA